MLKPVVQPLDLVPVRSAEKQLGEIVAACRKEHGAQEAAQLLGDALIGLVDDAIGPESTPFWLRDYAFALGEARLRPVLVLEDQRERS